MKKACGILFLLILLIVGASSFATAKSEPIFFGTENALTSAEASTQTLALQITWHQGSLYTLCTDGLYQYRNGKTELRDDLQELKTYLLPQEEANERMAPYIDTYPSYLCLASDEKTLICINTLNGRWAKWDGKQFLPGATLDMRELWALASGEEYVKALASPVLYEGNVYGLVDGEIESGMVPIQLVSWELDSGKMRVLTTGLFDAYTPMGDNAFMLLEREKDKQERVSFWAFDIENGEKHLLYQTGLNQKSFLAWNSAQKVCVFSNQREILKLSPEGEAEIYGYLAPSDTDVKNAVMMGNGQLAVCGYSMQVALYTLNEVTQIKTPLRVQNDGEGHIRKFKEAYPEILVEDYVFSLNTIPGTLELLTSGKDVPDIFMWPIHGYYYPAIKNGGYIQDISANESIEASTESFYPLIQEAITDEEGRLFAVPAYFWMNTWTLNATAWEEHVHETPPTTFLELISYMEEWENDEYNLMPFAYSKRELFGEVLRYYILQSQVHGELLSFDNESFKKTMEAIVSMNEQSLEVNPDKPSLLYPYCSSFDYWSGAEDPLQTGEWIVPMLVDPVGTPAVPISVEAYLLHGGSLQKKEALMFLQFVSEYERTNYPQRAVLMHSNMQEPVLSPEYIRKENEYYAKKEELESRLQIASAEDKNEIKRALDEAKQEFDAFSGKWWISAERLAQYREKVAPYLTFEDMEDGSPARPGNPLFDRLFEFGMLYIEGAAPLDTAIRQMSETMKMVVLEGMD